MTAKIIILKKTKCTKHTKNKLNANKNAKNDKHTKIQPKRKLRRRVTYIELITCMCACHTQYKQHRTVLIMFSLIFQTVTIDQTLSMGAEEDYKDACWLACVFDFPSLYLVVVVVWALHLMISNTVNDLQKILMRLTVSLAEPLPIQMPLYSTTICNVSLRIMSIWSKPRTDNLPQCGVPRRPSVTHKTSYE